MGEYAPPFSVSAKAIRLVAGIKGISPRQIEKYLDDMKKKGILLRIGARRNGEWKVLIPATQV